MRTIKYIVIHCTATPKGTTIESIQNYWKNNLKWKNPGYHKIIDNLGNIITLAPDNITCNGVAGHNSNSLHVSYIGGLKEDDRNDLQKIALIKVIKEWKKKYPDAIIQGHRDFKGVKKLCPQFNAKEEYKKI
jgi:N-acetylmuramoyl-L-alanine amidase